MKFFFQSHKASGEINEISCISSSPLGYPFMFCLQYDGGALVLVHKWYISVGKEVIEGLLLLGYAEVHLIYKIKGFYLVYLYCPFRP